MAVIVILPRCGSNSIVKLEIDLRGDVFLLNLVFDNSGRGRPARGQCQFIQTRISIKTPVLTRQNGLSPDSTFIIIKMLDR